MTFRRSAPAAIIAAVAVVIAAMTFASNRLFTGLTAAVETGQFRLMQSIMETALRNAAEDALARAEMIAALPAAREAVAAQDRERLPAGRICADVRRAEGTPRRRPGAVSCAAGGVAAAAARSGDVWRRPLALSSDRGRGQPREGRPQGPGHCAHRTSRLRRRAGRRFA